MKKKFAFMGSEPTPAQIRLADEQGINLIPVGDRDVFTVIAKDINPNGDMDGVVVAHPAAAMRLCDVMAVGVYEHALSENKEAVSLHVWGAL